MCAVTARESDRSSWVLTAAAWVAYCVLDEKPYPRQHDFISVKCLWWLLFIPPAFLPFSVPLCEVALPRELLSFGSVDSAHCGLYLAFRPTLAARFCPAAAVDILFLNCQLHIMTTSLSVAPIKRWLFVSLLLWDIHGAVIHSARATCLSLYLLLWLLLYAQRSCSIVIFSLLCAALLLTLALLALVCLCKILPISLPCPCCALLATVSAPVRRCTSETAPIFIDLSFRRLPQAEADDSCVLIFAAISKLSQISSWQTAL